MNLDIRTIFYLFGAGNFFTVTFFSAYILLHKERKSILNIFIYAKVLLTVSWIFFALRGVIPNLFSVMAANILLLFGVLYELYAVISANKHFSSKKFLTFNLIPIISSILFLAFYSAPENVRIVVISIILTIVYFGGFYYLIKSKERSKIQFLAGLFSLGLMILYFLRTIFTVFGLGIELLYGNNLSQVATYIYFFLFSLSLAIVLLLVLKEEDRKLITEDNKMLQQLIESKDKFFSIIAHDLRSPLSTLIQIGELLWSKHDEIDEKTKLKLNESIYVSSQKTFILLDNLLKWASNNSGLVKYSPEKLNIYDLIKENISFFKAKLELKEITVTNKLDKELFAFADYDMLNTVIRNLISNAVKFTPNLGSISVISDKSDSENISIAICDTGIGMTKKQQEQAFLKYHLRSTKGTDKETGFGLGLKLCEEFIIKNNGKIWIESQLSVGTNIWISLPKANTKA